MRRSITLLIIPVCLLFTQVACVEHASEPAPEIERGLVIHEDGGVVNGTFVDDEHELRFSGEVAGGGFDLHIQVNGMTIAAWQDSDGRLGYDGYANGTSAATQMTHDDRAALTALAEALDTLGPEAGPATARVRTFASTWSEFPSSLDLHGIVDISFRSTTSICDKLNTYIKTTHDDSKYKAGDDRTSFAAYMSMHAAGPCPDGTWFWSGGKWVCYEPNHSPDVEYAYGNCFGRCGNRCGTSTQFTTDCANYDNCQRFGHTVDDVECENEFIAMIDDSFNAPNCL